MGFAGSAPSRVWRRPAFPLCCVIFDRACRRFTRVAPTVLCGGRGRRGWASGDANGADAARVASRLTFSGSSMAKHRRTRPHRVPQGENAAAASCGGTRLSRTGSRQGSGRRRRRACASALGEVAPGAWSQELDARTQGRHGQPVSEQPKRHLADGRHRPRFQWKRPRERRTYKYDPGTAPLMMCDIADSVESCGFCHILGRSFIILNGPAAVRIEYISPGSDGETPRCYVPTISIRYKHVRALHSVG